MKKNKQDRYQPEPVKGVMDITRSGIGYVIIADGSGDVLVRPQDFNQAFNGDTVMVKITRDGINSKRREGRVDKVISRRQTEFIGTLSSQQGRLLFVPSGDRPLPYFELDAPLSQQVDEDQKVVVRLIDWPQKHRRPTGRLMEVLPADAVNDIAMKEIITEKGFPLAFSDEAIEAAARLNDTIDEDEISSRRDCREILTFTIDPVDAKDFDDAISLQKTTDGFYEIGVHIADVSHFLESDTPLDDEAYQRATSIYLPDRVNPMLPERISNELCSLRPHEDKYTFSILFKMNERAEVKDFWIGKTIIHSDHRYTYEDVQEIIKGGDGPYSDEILLVNSVSQQLRKERFMHGAINFSSQEVRFQLDEKGKPIGVVIKESFEAHQLIEELMLLANRYIAERVQKATVNGKPVPFPYRIHDTPDEEKLIPFAAFARKFGYKFNTSEPNTIAASFNAMLVQARGTPQQHVLEQLGIRTMAKAVYSTDNIGHYGLGFDNYCHFTSPIRRYPDVMVHRILQQVLQGHIPNDKKMEQKCKHSSDRERAAMECERAANKYKQVEFMSDHLGEEFEAVVAGVSSFGFWAETVEHKCEGLVSISYLNTFDDFRLIESDYQLVGMRSGRTFRMGDQVRIKVISANLNRRQLDYEWLPGEENKDLLPTGTKKEKPAKNAGDDERKKRAKAKSDANREIQKKRAAANKEVGGTVNKKQGAKKEIAPQKNKSNNITAPAAGRDKTNQLSTQKATVPKKKKTTIPDKKQKSSKKAAAKPVGKKVAKP